MFFVILAVFVCTQTHGNKTAISIQVISTYLKTPLTEQLQTKQCHTVSSAKVSQLVQKNRHVSDQAELQCHLDRSETQCSGVPQNDAENKTSARNDPSI